MFNSIVFNLLNKGCPEGCVGQCDQTSIHALFGLLIVAGVACVFGAGYLTGKPTTKKKTEKKMKLSMRDVAAFVVAAAKILTLTSCTYGLHELTLLNGCAEACGEARGTCIATAVCAAVYACLDFREPAGHLHKPQYDDPEAAAVSLPPQVSVDI